MKRTNFSEAQIIGILKQQDAGSKVADICREHGISDATFFKWKSRYSGMDTSQLKRLRELEEENSRLKKMYADLILVHYAFKDAVEKKL